jgi:hypothetical protein
LSGLGRSPRAGRVAGLFGPGEDVGTGLELAEPLKFDHSANIPFSVRGTGIDFKPATAFAHSSNEPVLPLVFSITLDRPLVSDWGIDEVVRDEKVKNAGYQGARKPDQWFGGPALAASAGCMVLRDAQGNVVDGLNYGGLVDPWMAEGYQAVSGTGANGSYVPSPGMVRGFRPGSLGEQPDRSAGRYPDGYDDDDNGHDFLLQHTMALALGAEAGASNVKVTSVVNFSVGQPCIVGLGANAETATIAVIGTAGGTKLEGGVDAGVTEIPVAGVAGFEAGQKITVGDEAAVVASVVVRRRGFGNRGGAVDSIVLSAPLKQAHAAGTEVSGTGIILARPLARAHEGGTPIASNLPTPGEPNQYIRK